VRPEFRGILMLGSMWFGRTLNACVYVCCICLSDRPFSN